MHSDNFAKTEVTSPQGGVCSPLLSNIYLCFLIFYKDKKTAGNYKAYVTEILEEELKLKVNQEKTKLTSIHEGEEFLGLIIRSKILGVNPKRIKRFKDKVRRITKRNSGRKLENIIKELNPVLREWMNYYRVANIKSFIRDFTGWLRRRLRMVKMKQWKACKG